MDRAMRYEEEDHDYIKALRRYCMLAQKGNAEALKAIVRIGADEINDYLQDEMLYFMDQKDSSIEGFSEDRRCIEGLSLNRPDDFCEEDYANLMSIADKYEILEDSVESMIDQIIEARDAMDTGWMGIE